MIDKDLCLNSYMAFRYIYKDDVDFYEGMHHKNYVPLEENKKVVVYNAQDINKSIQSTIDDLYTKYKKIGILLSGGMDSAIVASYLKEGSYAYTFSSSNTDIFLADNERAEAYCKKLGLIHKYINIDFEDYKKYTPIVMEGKCAPVHSIEPQIYKAALEAKKDGVEIMLIGDGADYVFGGMDKLLAKDWNYNDFIERYISLKPEVVLSKVVDITEPFKPFKKGEKIDFVSFMEGLTTIESYSSYMNAFQCAQMPYCDPYDILKMGEKLDLNRIRNGESKYLIRELYKIRYPNFEVPEKIPMPRPVDRIFANWEGPKRIEFKENIDLSKLSGNQKWQLWCAELFLNINEPMK